MSVEKKDPRESASNSEKSTLSRHTGRYEFPPLPEQLQCPQCGESSVIINRTPYNLPDGDEILILLIECQKCGYRKSDTIPLVTVFQPGEYHLTVDDGDFTHKIFRGATGDIEIPEIGVSIERGPAAMFDFTNIEGILLKIEEQIVFFLKTTSHNSESWTRGNEALERLKQVLRGNLVFTVILRDEIGGSYISPSNPQKMRFIPFSPTENTLKIEKEKT